MMEEIAKYGTPTTKRIYADWLKPNAAGWKTVLLDMQSHQFSNTAIRWERTRQIQRWLLTPWTCYTPDKVDGFVSFLVILILQD
jgi:hypothetical protein